ncbi:hypothetical protein [Clostridium baratii]|uniref:hypothetical protein n=1 Tax=Clostridium baratii TaxID=1561 RepID=UPI0030D404F5
MKIVLILLILGLLVSLFKWFRYFCGVRGLLYYLGMKYNDMPSDEKTKELTNMAMERTIKEFFGQV